MHLMITQTKYKGKVKKYAKIVQSYNDKNTSRQKIILNLGIINSEADEKNFRTILNSMRKKRKFVDISNIKAKTAKEYGITYTTDKLLEKYEIDSILKNELSKNNAKFRIYPIIKALIINRLVNPSSDLSAYNWICNDYCKKINIQKHNIYRALDYLIERKDDIEKDIYTKLKNKLNLNTKKVHYDLTSSYLEGHNCQIAMYGYSRDHRPDRQQIVIGLVMVDGIPIYHKVFEGNTADKSTLSGIAEKLKSRFDLKAPIIIADRGLITEENLQMLETNKQKYILGFSKRNNNLTKELIVQDIKSNKNQIAKIIKTENNRKYVLCLDNNTRNERLEILENIKKNISGKLNELTAKFEKSQASDKKNKITKESLILQVDKILGKNRRLFDLKYEDETFLFNVNKDAWDYEQKSAGKFLLVTNTNLKADEVMKSYKALQSVENAFDEIKNFLDVRPIWHFKESRVKAHVFVCVLGFLIESIIERYSKESARRTLKKLGRIKKIELGVNNSDMQLITESTKEIEDIFANLKIPKIIL